MKRDRLKRRIWTRNSLPVKVQNLPWKRKEQQEAPAESESKNHHSRLKTLL
jgi:hypothetical protein